MTVDSGATGNMIRFDVVKRLNLNIRKNTQKSNQADGHSHLDIVGEVTIEFQFKEHRLILEALVAAKLDDEVLGGIPFMKKNDVWVRPRKNLLGIGDATYTYKDQVSSTSRVRRVQPTLVRSPANMTVWPGGYVELQVPETFAGKEIGIEPRIDSMVNSNQTSSSVLWPSPQVVTCSDTTIRIPNLSANPLSIRKDDHLYQIVRTVTVEQSDYIKNNQEIASPKPPPMIHENHLAYKDIIIDPDKRFIKNLEPLQPSVMSIYDPLINKKDCMIEYSLRVIKYPYLSKYDSIIIAVDEETTGYGTPEVIKYLRKRREKIDFTIVGAPSSNKKVGDEIRIGRRGSMNAKLTVYGKSGQSAFYGSYINPCTT